MEYRPLGRTGVKVSQICLGTMMYGPQSHDVNDSGLSRRHIIDACEASLRRLQTDWIDLYQLHRSRAGTPIDETLRALREVIPAARSFGVAIIPWGRLCGGLLTGKYERDGGGADGRWRDGNDNFGRAATPLAWDTIDLVKTIAAEKGRSPSQVALAWCGAQPGVTAPIIGPRTYEQAVDNLGAADVEITPADQERIDALVPPCGVAVCYYDRANGLDLRPHLQRVP